MTQAHDDDPALARRRQAYAFGLRAETVAVLYLRLKGWRVVARRFLARGGEIDIVALRGDVLAFVEVKARPTLDEARCAITPRKARRMSVAARAFISRHAWAMGKTWRGDAVFLAPRRWPRHAPGAVDLDL
ncbi:MAG TPA: YraN family protein [Beijerinckiaceae bacterium]